MCRFACYNMVGVNLTFLQLSLTNAFLLLQTKQTPQSLSNITILGASKSRYIEELLTRTVIQRFNKVLKGVSWKKNIYAFIKHSYKVP